MTLYIKNMVCNRCVTAVSGVMERVGLHAEKITLGEVVVQEDNLEKDQLTELDKQLTDLGFERIDDRKGRMVESIKNTVIRKIYQQDELSRKLIWSGILSEELHYDYNYLSSLFSSLEGTTLEQYIIQQKIERAKELLFYDELTLSQIALRLGYSSVAHLSAQFKKVTGLTPSELKKQKNANRRNLDEI
jgi:AraC family transcriptional regulator